MQIGNNDVKLVNKTNGIAVIFFFLKWKKWREGRPLLPLRHAPPDVLLSYLYYLVDNQEISTADMKHAKLTGRPEGEESGLETGSDPSCNGSHSVHGASTDHIEHIP